MKDRFKIKPDGLFLEKENAYITGSGQILFKVHDESKCKSKNCVIHNPSDHHMRDFPTLWRQERRLMERICKCGVGHPDPDEINPDTVHGCCGCCEKPR